MHGFLWAGQAKVLTCDDCRAMGANDGYIAW
jgi:hypothetical protein